MHGIDYFCTINKMTLTDLANHLGIKKTAITGWKKGTKNFAKHHKKSIIELFEIPEDKEYLLEMREINQVERMEIEQIFQRNSLVDAQIKGFHLAIPKIESDIMLIERQLQMHKLLNKLKMEITSSVLDEPEFNKKLNRLDELIEELKKLKGDDGEC